MAIELDAVITKAARAVEVLGRRTTVSAAYLFGSQVDGRADADSDIDLAVFVDGADEWDIHRLVELDMLVQREVGNDIEMHFFSATAFENSEPASFATYVKKHGVRVPIDE